ncbi:hypothetical protein BV378_10130 [Nostoc sp. RF31YmG]|nr:hypothetical protein BV378_10130 [Nostoc sp. RF31YmG]
MKTSTKVILGVAVLSALGLGGLVRSSYANQSQPTIVTSEHSANTHVPEVSDGDGEANDATEPPEVKQQPQNSQTVTPGKKQTNENEANEGANDSDGGANEDTH